VDEPVVGQEFLASDGEARATQLEVPNATDRICIRGSELYVLDRSGTVLVTSVIGIALDLVFAEPPADWSEFKAFIRARIPRAYSAWSAAEDKLLQDQFTSGISIEELAERHKRSRGAIRARLVKLGLLGAASR